MLIKSYAKVNLILKLGPRKEKLHEVVTLISKINLFDELKVNLNSSGKVRVITKNIKIKQQDNLVYKAIMLLKKTTGFKQGVEVEIKKNIPVMAGLGGGSSNAAATLLFLNRKLKLNLPANKINQLAIKLGSDVPSFLEPGTVLVGGNGEKLTKVKIKLPRYVFLVKPNKGVKTSTAYQVFDAHNLKPKKPNLEQTLKLLKQKELLELMVNDLEAPLYKEYNFLNKTNLELAKFGFDKVMLSGSGSTLFGITNKADICKNAYSKMHKKYGFIGIYKFFNTR